MEAVFVIIGVVAFASWLARKAQVPGKKRIDVIEKRLNEVGEQVADFLINDE